MLRRHKHVSGALPCVLSSYRLSNLHRVIAQPAKEWIGSSTTVQLAVQDSWVDGTTRRCLSITWKPPRQVGGEEGSHKVGPRQVADWWMKAGTHIKSLIFQNPMKLKLLISRSTMTNSINWITIWKLLQLARSKCSSWYKCANPCSIGLQMVACGKRM